MGKRNFILLIILLVIVILILFSLKKENKPLPHNYIFKNLNFKDISEFKLKNFTIKNINGTWKIDNETCNSHEIEYLVNLLKSTDFSNVISEDPSTFEKFKVTDNSSLKVEIKTTDGKNYKIYIGKITPDGNGCYIRYKNKVYLITQNIKIDFNKEKKDFYLHKKVKKSKKK